MRASGNVGELRVAYQRAAVLGAWTLEQEARAPTSYIFQAVISQAHDYWIGQRPIDLVIAVGRTEWRWRDVTLAFEDGRVTAHLAERPLVSDRQDAAPEAGTSIKRGAWR